ncbi:MAG: cobalt transporter CbiM [Treponema sp.]|jgi:cobalt/nickel transport system permease protein|nr:cobalt transporter CbiM [Treponema sp.]
MHISEGVLSLPVIAGGWVIGTLGVAVGLRKTAVEQLSKTALVSATLFLASLVHVPVGPSSIHLTLLGLSGWLLGWPALPALFVALLLQGILFQFGGLLSLGANMAIMGVATLSGYVARLLFGVFSGILRSRATLAVSAFLAGFAAVIAGSVLVVAALVLSANELQATAALIMAANVPLAFVEGGITLSIILFLAKVKPDVLESP